MAPPPDVRIADNPFFVLGLSPDATRMDLEREAQKLLGMLELGFADAATYATPVGQRPRTVEAVRTAIAALRDPQQRLLAELWARHAPAQVATAAPAPVTTAPVLARRKLGWP